MRPQSRILGYAVLRLQQRTLQIFPCRIIPMSCRPFSGLPASRQQTAAAEDIRGDDSRYGDRRAAYRGREASDWNRDHGRFRPRELFQEQKFTDAEGNELPDDMVKLKAVDGEAVEISQTETIVRDDQYAGYKPVHWLAYKGKIDDGFLESMKHTFRYSHLTEVQHTLLSKVPLKNDLIVRSKTGTGKTIAFLIPAIQRHIDYMKEAEVSPRVYSKSNTGVLIVSPTRELAIQIGAEARRLIHLIQPSGMKVQVLVGGDSKREQIRRMDRERNDIIVATPGRLIDFMETEPGVNNMFMSIQTLIFDEVDTLLDMGFRSDVEKILRLLQPTEQQRRNMMFSATLSSDIKRLAERELNHDVEFINTVKHDDLDVHQKVGQTYILRDMGDRLKLVLSLIIKEQLEKPQGKVIVFFNTTKEVQLYTLLFRYLRRLYANPHFQQFEIHSKKDQDIRTKVNNAFRRANVGSVLFTTDVSARGVDYPGVTKVIQVGAPVSRDIYIHRVGRTGRAGADGSAVLILAPFEEHFLRELTDIPMEDCKLPESELETGPAEDKVLAGAKALPPPGMIEETFMSMLGYYAPKLKQWRSPIDQALSEMENWALAIGAPAIPRVSENFLTRLLGSRHSQPRRSSSSGRSRGRQRYDERTSFNDGMRSHDTQGRQFSDRYGSGRQDGRSDDRPVRRRDPPAPMGRLKKKFQPWPYRRGDKY